MNALDRKITNLLTEYIKKNHKSPKFARCTIRWKDDATLVKGMVFSFSEYNVDTKDDDGIFFYLGGNSASLISLAANLDFTVDEFDNEKEWILELSKYDDCNLGLDEQSPYNSNEDFDIVDIECYFIKSKKHE